MKRFFIILFLLLSTALLAACTFGEADQPLYTVRPTAALVQSKADPSAGTSAPSTDSNGSTEEIPSVTSDEPLPPHTTVKPDPTPTSPPITTAKPAATTAKPIVTAPPATTTQPPVPSGSIIVTAEVKTVKEGETYTGLAPLPTISFTVKDPDNKAGLSDEKTNYSFGVAKDGKPHAISVNHQTYFDSHQHAALTLDTISDSKVLYLTFDCGYEYQNLTGNILDTLKEKNVPAAFFCTMDYLKTAPQFVVRMINEGHIVGNHSTTHPIMPDKSKERMASEILGVDNYLRVNFGYTSPYFRFPTGAYSEEALDLVDSVGFRSIFWSIAHADWDTANQPSVKTTYDTIISRLHPGAVILLHAVSQSNADALADIIDYARANGYEFRSLDEYPGW